MYSQYFGLTEPPFSITPDPRYLYLGERQREAMAYLKYGLSQNDGFIQLTGEIGTGKTTLVRAVLSRLPESVDAVLIFNPELSRSEFLETVLHELGVPMPSDGRRNAASLLNQFYRYLLTIHARGHRVVLLIDEAQRLSTEVLEQIRLLTNLETERHKLLNVILVGQPELRDTLARTELRQLAQRITARYHLDPLTSAETAAYIRHRLAIGGAPGRIFTPRAVKAIHHFSWGVPRLINLLCDRSLMAAYALELREANHRLVRRAARELAGEAPSRARRKKRLSTSLGLFAVLATSSLIIARVPDIVTPSTAVVPHVHRLERSASDPRPMTRVSPGSMLH